MIFQSSAASFRRLFVLVTVVCSLTSERLYSDDASPPQMGMRAPDFALPDLKKQEVRLSGLTKHGPVVVLMLRGYPGYQCPLCTKQVADFLSHARDFQTSHAHVVLVYPGSATLLGEHAREFARGKDWPENFHFVIDTDFKMTESYHLRWNAPQETAYPSTFVIDSQGIVRFSKVSRSHGGRTKAEEIVREVAKLK